MTSFSSNGLALVLLTLNASDATTAQGLRALLAGEHSVRKEPADFWPQPTPEDDGIGDYVLDHPVAPDARGASAFYRAATLGNALRLLTADDGGEEVTRVVDAASELLLTPLVAGQVVMEARTVEEAIKAMRGRYRPSEVPLLRQDEMPLVAGLAGVRYIVGRFVEMENGMGEKNSYPALPEELRLLVEKPGKIVGRGVQLPELPSDFRFLGYEWR